MYRVEACKDCVLWNPRTFNCLHRGEFQRPEEEICDYMKRVVTIAREHEVKYYFSKVEKEANNDL